MASSLSKDEIAKIDEGLSGVSPSWMAYLRGKYYNDVKLPWGGDRSGSEAGGDGEFPCTAARLAADFKISVPTIYRDARFSVAVDAIAANCGDDAKQALLARGSGLTHGAVIALAKKGAELQKNAIRAILQSGKLPGWISSMARAKATITVAVPVSPEKLAEKLLRHHDAKEVLDIISRLRGYVERRSKTRTSTRERTGRAVKSGN